MLHRSITTAGIAALLMGSTLVGGCATTGPRIAGTPNQATTQAFEKLKALAGTWESVDDKGQKQVAAVFSVTGGGSAVREIMFPGSPHEMTNMYHLDGSSIVATHYCAMGNQPRMRCAASDGKTFDFRFDDITNLPSKDVDPMASLVLTVHDANRITQDWDTLKADGSHNAVFELTRKN
ncbi:MAG: hypothetical protein JNL80_05925 [Phycisphaerae bacterium]|jgi:hypothetical protein|nr:hypothetical protein [Phycisphaerae bacterium]